MVSYQRIGKGGKKYWGKSAAGIFFTDGAKVLLLKRSDKGDAGGTWGLPGGKTEEGETAIGTAIRECQEECGKVEGHRFEKSEEKDHRHLWTTFFYKVSKPFDCRISDEHTDWKWISFDDLSEYKLHPKLDENMDRYMTITKKKFGVMEFKDWLG